MSKQQMSKNEPVDKTVDLKLGKWREKSIALEEERKKEEEERIRADSRKGHFDIGE